MLIGKIMFLFNSFFDREKKKGEFQKINCITPNQNVQMKFKNF